ncbi:hypothetical protein [Bacillus sp. FJAT-22090]|uniref:hypothetical protein n=1 Tax=Bacillus sp. FJAT-22090 TaxID=1581038 RepID=UPI0011A7C0B6|nr:hypothetical protein [Bacillus sp. FJAT-22090]
MYDPTIFENLKVAFENHVYDLDNIEQKVHIVNRLDRMDFSILAREFAIKFTMVEQKSVIAEIVLEASLEDLAGEILETSINHLGCSLLLRFYKHVQNVNLQCKEVERTISSIWENEIQVTQTLSYIYEQKDSSYLDTIEVKFINKINEEHMGEIEDFLKHVLKTMEVLQEL